MPDLNPLVTTERRIITITTALEAELELSWITIEHKFNQAPSEDRAVAETKTDWEYRQATIIWYLPQAALLDTEDLERVAVHEYIHIFLDPLYKLIPDSDDHVATFNEYVTENLTRMVYAARSHPCPSCLPLS